MASIVLSCVSREVGPLTVDSYLYPGETLLVYMFVLETTRMQHPLPVLSQATTTLLYLRPREDIRQENVLISLNCLIAKIYAYEPLCMKRDMSNA